MGNKMLEDANGNKSSKRIIGTVALCLFFLIVSVTAGLSVAKGSDIGSNARDLVVSMGAIGGGLLGAGVFEKLTKKD